LERGGEIERLLLKERERERKLEPPSAATDETINETETGEVLPRDNSVAQIVV
jgi:hypothetical protein